LIATGVVPPETNLRLGQEEICQKGQPEENVRVG